MIMAGRGRRFTDIGDPSKKLVGIETSSDIVSSDLPLLITKINEIDLFNVNSNQLDTIQNSFKEICTSKEIIKDVLANFHSKALDNYDFGEKMLIALEPLLNFEINEVRVRNELLSFMQKDFAVKDALVQSDKKKFLNAVMLLGNGYKRIKVCGAPICVLGVALLEYFDILLLGEEEEDLKVLTTQILINGYQLSLHDKVLDKYNLLQHSLRNALVTKNFNFKCKYWILLGLDFMANGFQPLTKVLEDYYLKNLGDNYKNLKPYINQFCASISHSLSVPESVKSHENVSLLNKTTGVSSKKKDVYKKDLSEKFSEINMSKSEDEKEKSNQSKNKRDNQRWLNKDKVQNKNTKESSISEHDDRFEKEEDFYGVQNPRRPKGEKPRKNYTDGMGSKKNYDNESRNKIGGYKNKDQQNIESSIENKSSN